MTQLLSLPQASPTLQQFGAYQGAFDYFNAQLFADRLPPCMLNFSRLNKAFGFYVEAHWSNGRDKIAEISLNPAYLFRDPKSTLATVVHEMVHHWQFVAGKPSRRSYHNREWAKKMIELGLHPSSTGQPGGATTGQKVSHYVIDGGPYEVAFDSMPQEIRIPWTYPPEPKKEKKKRAQNKLKYTCSCGVNVWGKPRLNVICGKCKKRFEAEEVDEDDED